MNNFTMLENNFIFEYLPAANGDAVKVYVYGLYLCSLSGADFSVAEFCARLNLSKEKVLEYFTYWEEMGLVHIHCREPLEVIYLSVSKISRNKKPTKEKYTDFAFVLQSYISERMITPNEFSDYFSFMETQNMTPEAFLMIAKYCVDMRGTKIGRKYILTVAENFAYKKIITVEGIESELHEYATATKNLHEIFAVLKISKQPDIEHNYMYRKWIKYGYNLNDLLHIAGLLGKNTLEYFNDIIKELYMRKYFERAKIEEYLKTKDTNTHNLLIDLKSKKSEADDELFSKISYAETDAEYAEIAQGINELNRLIGKAIFQGSGAEEKTLRAQLDTLENKKARVLKRLGLSEKDLTPVYVCKICNDTGFAGNKKCACMSKRA